MEDILDEYIAAIDWSYLGNTTIPSFSGNSNITSTVYTQDWQGFVGCFNEAS